MSWRPPSSSLQRQYAAASQQQQQQQPQQQQQQQQQHLYAARAHSQTAATHAALPHSTSSAYAAFAHYANVAQGSVVGASQWPALRPAPQPTPSTITSSTPAVQPRGKGLSYAELLSRAEKATASMPSAAAIKTVKKRKAEKPLPVVQPSRNRVAPSPSAPVAVQAFSRPESHSSSQSAPLAQRAKTVQQPAVHPTHSRKKPSGSGSNAVHPAQYPPALLRLVERAFAECKTAAEKEECQAALKATIEKAVRDNRIWTLNWDNVSSPLASKKKTKKQLKLENKKAKLQAKMLKEKTKASPAKKSNLKLSTSDKLHMTKASSVRQRNQRFANTQRSVNKNQPTKKTLKMSFGSTEISAGDIDLDWESLKIKGTSTELEKEYLRLTSAPDPSSVRPEHILKKAFHRLLEKWKKDRHYFYFVQQMKAIRQDLTIQHIVNSFTVLVYEENARICLEVEDMSEYNQCQTQLVELYTDHPKLKANQYEFISYQIYYYLLVRDYASIAKMMSEMDESALRKPEIQLALEIRRCVFVHDYVNFFRLCVQASTLSMNILRRTFPHLRLRALQRIVKGFRPSVPVSMICSVLGLGDVDSCQAFLLASGAIFNDEGNAIVTKECTDLVPVDLDSLRMEPEKDYGITHGKFGSS